MCADIEMQNLLGTYTFKSLSETNVQLDIIAYALINGNITDVSPRNWTNNFKGILETCGGALVIITRHETSDELTQIFETYTRWCHSNIHKDVKLTPITTNWAQYTHDGNDIIQTFKYRILIKGQMLVISGEFPNIRIDMDATFGLEIDTFSRIYPSLLIATFKSILTNTIQILPEVKTDIFEKFEKNKRTVLMRTSFQERFTKSRKGYLSDLYRMLTEADFALRSIRENMRYYGTSVIPGHVTNDIQTEMNWRKNDINVSVSKLEEMIYGLESNRRRFFDFAESVIDVFFAVVLAIACASIWFIYDKRSNLRLFVLVATCLIGVFGLMLKICVAAMREFWKFRMMNF